jgi:hypothetical protein
MGRIVNFTATALRARGLSASRRTRHAAESSTPVVQPDLIR